MTDIGLFMFGCCVFGIALTATMVLVIGPSQSNSTQEENRKIADKARAIREHNALPASTRGDE